MRRLAVLACTTLLAACAGEIGPEEEGGLGTTAIQHVPANGIVFFPGALAAFKSSRLASQTFDPVVGHPELKNLPFDDETRKFLKYTVECALAPAQKVRFQGDVYNGLFAECPAWNALPPNQDCLEAVSGCLLARQNPMDLRVRFSGVGQTAAGSYINVDVWANADTYEEDYLGTKISSFWTSCNGTTGELRECGWTAATSFTGTCTPGALTSVGAGAKLGDCNNALGSALPGVDMVLRVCDGMSGCNASSPRHLGSNNDACGKNPAVDFVCEPSGVFSAMLSARKAGAVFGGTVGVSSGSPAEYPSTMLKLFDVLEATYYGDMFNKINPNVTLTSLGPNEGSVLQISDKFRDHTGFNDPQVFPFEDAWCCHDPNYPSQYMDNGRVCAVVPVLDPGGNLAEANLCACQSLGACNTVEKNSRSNLCAIWDQIPFFGDIDHDECRDGDGVPRRFPMTVFLHDSCDMVGEEGRDLCVRK